MFTNSHVKYTFLFILLFLTFIITDAYADERYKRLINSHYSMKNMAIPGKVKVRLLSIKTIREVKIQSDNLTLSNGDIKIGDYKFQIFFIPGTNSVFLKDHQKKLQLASPIKINSKHPVFVKIPGVTRKVFQSPLYIRNTGKQLIITSEIPFENYIAGVVYGEMPGGTPEALKAQAVVARSYALKNMDRHKDEGYNFCDCTHCQVYKGYVNRDSRFFYAAVSTGGLVLKHAGTLVDGLYHSTCGGKTSMPVDVYGSVEPGVTGVTDIISKEKNKEILCGSSPHFRWKYKITAEELLQILKKEPLYDSIDGIEEIRILKKDAAGRVLILQIIGKERILKISGYDFWQMTGSHKGWGKFKSACFTVKTIKPTASKKSQVQFVFLGKGLGHGLGMCQWGAMRMGEKGYSFRQILKHYFPESEIVPY